ncbi:MAG: acyltransferase [Pseudomonadota bacterium]
MKFSSARRIISDGKYLPIVDGLRFLAILPVVFSHLNSRAWNAYKSSEDQTAQINESIYQFLNIIFPARSGVALFFVISGFILAMPFLKYYFHGGEKPTLVRFYKKRLTRLEPPYIIATLMSFFFLCVTLGFLGISKFHEVNGYTLFQSLTASLLYLHGTLLQELPHIIPVAWSLEIEFQFYILAPFLFHIYSKQKKITNRLLVGFFSMLLSMALSNRLLEYVNPDAIRFSLIRYIGLFILGCIVCDVFLKLKILEANAKKYFWDIVFIFSFVTVAVTDAFMRDYRRPIDIPLELLRFVAFSGVFFGCFLGKISSKIFSTHVLSLIGGMCYTIYLLHLPIQQVLVPKLVSVLLLSSYLKIFFLSAFIILPVTLSICFAFYYFIERPCMRSDWPKNLLYSVKRYKFFNS